MDKKWTSGNELAYLKQVLSNTDEVKAKPFTDRLERAVCSLYGFNYAIAMNSATSALHAGLFAAGVGPGDEVITTPYTVLVDSSIPILMGAKPVFADIEYGTHNIDPASVESLVTERTKVIIPVAYHGLPYDMDAITSVARKHGLIVLEDDAQAIHARYKGRFVGGDADMTAFSFERTKHVSSGEGGMLIVKDEEMAEKARKFAGMGFKALKAAKSKLVAITPSDFQNPEYERHDAFGFNFRFNEFCAAVALAQFERVEDLVGIRRKVAWMYDEVFKGTEFEPQAVPEGYESSYFTYAVKSPYRSTEQWLEFHRRHVANGGDDFYAMMTLAYAEPIMRSTGYHDLFNGTCPVAEDVQPRSMLFKTNYRDLETAEIFLDKLRESIQRFA